MFHTYILRCADDTLYVGCTNDLAKRLHQHNHARGGAKYTSGRRPVILVYKKSFRTYTKARATEGEWKRLSRAEKLALIGA
ncbi:MAG: GIY-YIG nuclease family protein [Candidatus Paceibacterota bacterium]